MLDVVDPRTWTWFQQYQELLGLVGGTFLIAGMGITAAHAVLNKSNTRAATGWVGLIWFAPGLGILLYYLFGINRIKRRARDVLGSRERLSSPRLEAVISDHRVESFLPPDRTHLHTLSNLVRELTSYPLTRGNRIDALPGGTEAYGSMLEAIRNASRSITLGTYIFSSGDIGSQFVDALVDARNRGIEVRVLIDDVGSRYTWPPVDRTLRAAGVPVERFMPTWLPWRFRYLNLRNHRKILVVDGRIGFTGGMNIAERFWSGEGSNGSPHRDLHFRLEGPVVAQLQNTFAEDWLYARGERLRGEPWFPELEPTGESIARGVAAGPDEDYDKLRLVLLGALSVAEDRIRVVTPYFLPDDELISSLNIAAMRGVDVEILLPRENNLRMVHWASMDGIRQLLERGCHVFFTPPSFDHSKLVIVDDCWVFLGSSNWDPRSLKLNFEFNVECYDQQLAHRMNDLFEEKQQPARRVTLPDLRDRNTIIRLRDGVARLFLPYL